MPAVRHSPGPRRIMDGAGANHDQQAIVFTCQDPACLMALVVDVPGPCRPDRVLRQQLGRWVARLYGEGAHDRIQNCHLELPCCACAMGNPYAPSCWEQTDSRLIAVVENDCHYLGVCLKCKRNEIARRRWGEERWRGTAAKSRPLPGGKKPASHKIKRGSAVHHGVPVLMVGVFIPCRCASRGLV